ncbi:MAG: helix-turn-helix domain-containing protein, partial [Caldimonas sp.]
LENICHWLTVMAPGQVIDAKDLPPELQTLRSAARAADAESAPHASIEPTPASRAASAASDAAGHTSDSSVPVPPASAAAAVPAAWLGGLERDARALLEAGAPDVWDTLIRKFEAQLIRTALEVTRGRRIEAAQKLGIGRNTITRKIQELGLDD